VHLGDLAGRFSDLEMTWLLYCAGAATVYCLLAFSRTVPIRSNVT